LGIACKGWSSRSYHELTTSRIVLQIWTTTSQRGEPISDSCGEVRPTWTPHRYSESARDDVEVTYVMNPINLDVSDALRDHLLGLR